MTRGSKDLCGNTTERKNQESGKNTRKRHHIHRATKNEINYSIERIEEMVCELEGYRWDANINERNLEARQVRNLGNTPETHLHGSRQIRQQTQSWHSVEQELATKKLSTPSTSTNGP